MTISDSKKNLLYKSIYRTVRSLNGASNDIATIKVISENNGASFEVHIVDNSNDSMYKHSAHWSFTKGFSESSNRVYYTGKLILMEYNNSPSEYYSPSIIKISSVLDAAKFCGIQLNLLSLRAGRFLD
jgi:hypothetical protein